MVRFLAIVVITLFAPLSVTFAQTVVEQCGCSGLLGRGAFDKVRSETSENATRDELQFVAFSTYDEFKTAASAGGALDYFGSYGKFGFDANWNRDQFESHQRNLVTQYHLTETRDFRTRLLTDYASSVIVNGYNECIRTCVGIQGYRAWFNANDQRNLTLNIYNGVSGEPPSVRGLSISGARLRTRRPTQLNAGPNVFSIERIGNQPIQIVFRMSSGGDITAYTPAYRPPPAAPAVPPQTITRYINPKLDQPQLVGQTRANERGQLFMAGRWSAWDSGNAWWPPERCCVRVRLTNVQTGAVEQEVDYRGRIEIPPNREIFIIMGDSTYGDNRSLETDPLRAILIICSPPSP